MRVGRSLGALLVAGLAAPAMALGVPGQSSVSSSGSVLLSWHSRPDTCAPAGLCGITGSVRLQPNGIEASFERQDGRWVLEDLSPTEPSTPVVRETRTQSGAPDATCIDSLGSVFDESFAVRPATAHAPARVAIGGYAPEDGPLWAGRCAGPLPIDVARAMPSAAFSLRRPIDLRAQRAFSAGPFAGEIDSSLVLHAHPIHVSGRSFGSGRSPGGIVFAVVSVPYRIDAVDGGFSATIAGAESSACQVLDACGATGHLDLGLTGLPGATMVIGGARPLRPGQRYSRAQAIGDLRRGRLVDFGGFLDSRTVRRATTETFTRLGSDEPCADTSTGPAPDLRADGNGTSLRFAVDAESIGGLGDLMRTRCPGPGLAEVIGRRPILAGDIPLASLGDDRLAPALTAGGRFDAGAWTGTRGGRMTLTLSRSGPLRVRRLSEKAYEG